MKTVKVDMEMPEIEGYEYTGEFRLPSAGDLYRNTRTGEPLEAFETHNKENDVPQLILRKKKPERWRAENDGVFWFLNSVMAIESTMDWRYVMDNCLFKGGNYFKTEEQAMEAARRVKETLLAYQKELLEERK